MKVIFHKDRVIKLLDGRSFTWLLEKINESGVKLSQPGFNHLINGRAEWKVLYALVIARILNSSVEYIFSLDD